MTAAPLIAIPQAPVPAGGEAEWFNGGGPGDLRAALFPAKGKAHGSIVLSGGRTEPIEKYFEVIEELTGRGYVVLAHDWRGQGLSHRSLTNRLAGHADGYQAFLDDYHALLAKYESRLPKPWFAIGHSMGGCLTLLALAHGQAPRFEGAILSAPMLGIQTGGLPRFVARGLAGLKVLLGQGGDLARPDNGPPETFKTNVLTHDKARYERAKAQVVAHPDLGLGGPTWGWLDFAFRATTYLARAENLKSVTIPVVIVSAEQDKLVDNDAQRAAARNLPKGQLISVPGAYHEILMETDSMRNIFLRALDALLGRSPPAAAPAAKPAEPAPAPQPLAAAPTPAPAPKPEVKPESAPQPAPVAAAPAAPAAKAPAKKAAAKPAAPKTEPKKAEPKKTAAKAPAATKAPAAPKPAAPKKTAAPKAAAAKAAPKHAPKPAAKASAKPAPAKKAAAPAAKAATAAKAAAAKAAAPKAAAKAAPAKAAAKPAKAPAAKAAAPKAAATPKTKAAAPKKAPAKT